LPTQHVGNDEIDVVDANLNTRHCAVSAPYYPCQVVDAPNTLTDVGDRQLSPRTGLKAFSGFADKSRHAYDLPMGCAQNDTRPAGVRCN